MQGLAIIDPRNMRIHVEGYGDMTEDVARELAAMRQEDTDRVAEKAARRQAYLARELGEATHFDGGCVVAQVDEGVYQHWVDRYGAQFFSDRSNRNYFLKRHPECRVHSKAKNPTLLVSGFKVNDRRSAATS
jgi:hypothetical protein